MKHLSLILAVVFATACYDDPTGPGPDEPVDAACPIVDARVRPDAAVVDAAADAFEQVCGALDQQCCYPDAALATCAAGLGCAHGDGVPSWTCQPLTCAGDVDGLCPMGQLCIDTGGAGHTCVNCGHATEPCCNLACEIGTTCTNDVCESL